MFQTLVVGLMELSAKVRCLTYGALICQTVCGEIQQTLVSRISMLNQSNQQTSIEQVML